MNKKLHIAFITPEYPHEKVKHAAGIGTSIKNLADALIEQNVKVTVFVYSQNTSQIFKDNNIEIHLIQHKKYSFLGWYLYRKHLQKYINKEVEKQKIQLLEAPDWTGITAFMKFKVPLVIRFHGTDAYFCKLENRKQKYKNYFFEKTALQKATAYISPTKFTAALTQQLFNLNPKKIKTIYHGINTNAFVNNQPNQFRENTLLYVGTLIRKKGVLELAKIFTKLVEINPKAKLVLIGTDSFDIVTKSASTFNLMKELMSKKAIEKTVYLGRVSHKEVQQQIQEAQVCVFPTFAETFGMVTVEAMAMQKTVLNSNIGWAKEIIKDKEDGYLIHPTKTDKYVTIINSLFNNNNLCLQLGQQARKTVEERFNITQQSIKNITFYQNIINDNCLSS